MEGYKDASYNIYTQNITKTRNTVAWLTFYLNHQKSECQTNPRKSRTDFKNLYHRLKGELPIIKQALKLRN